MKKKLTTTMSNEEQRHQQQQEWEEPRQQQQKQRKNYKKYVFVYNRTRMLSYGLHREELTHSHSVSYVVSSIRDRRLTECVRSSIHST